jgi:GT2 family glycosyltransferase
MISIVIPSYNRRDAILRLLEGLRLQQGVEFEVIVVDDGSSDDSVAAIRDTCPWVRLFVNERNGGPAVTRNRGIREAKGEIVVGLDSDVTVVDPFLLSRVRVAFDAYPEAAGLAFRILKPDGVSEDVERWWHPVPIDQYADKCFLTSYFSGTGYAFRKEAIIRAGLFPEIFYMHYEEVELALRIIDDGGSILHCPDLKVLHHEGKTSGRSRVQLYYKPRNQILLALSCYPFWKALSYVVPRIGFQFGKAVFNRHVRVFASAILDGVATARRQLAWRKPLKSPTFHQLKRLREGVAP